MSAHDNVGSLLSALTMGQVSKKVSITHRKSKYLLQILDALKREGYILGYADKKNYKIQIFLKYLPSGTPVISGIKRMSTPGRRFYVRFSGLQKIQKKGFTLFVTTSHGVMSAKDAVYQKIGGELICSVY